LKKLKYNLQAAEHAGCVVCGLRNKDGLKLNFNLCQDGSVESRYNCPKTLNGYKDIVHGGIISMLLDGAMTNCLFAHGVKAFTAELKTRFLLPVSVKNAIRLKASIQRAFSRFYQLKAYLIQHEQIKAQATAIFARLPVASQSHSGAQETRDQIFSKKDGVFV